MFQSTLKNDWSWNPRTYSDLGVDTDDENIASEMCSTFFDFTEINSLTHNSMIEEPVEIIISFTYDLDLRVIHQVIREKIIKIYKKLESYDFQIVEIENNIKSGRLTLLDVKYQTDKLNKLKEFKRINMNNNMWQSYKNQVIPILNKYVILMSNEYRGLTSIGSTFSIDEFKIQERISYIKKYIEIVNRIGIIRLKATQKIIHRDTCLLCSKQYSEDEIDEESCKSTCKCGYTENSVKHVSEFVDINKPINQLSVSNANIKTIVLWLNRVKCASGDTYPKEELFKKFDNLCSTRGFPNRQLVLNLLIPQPSMKTIINLLQLSDFTEFYTIKHLIRYDYYGYQPLQISNEQEQEIIRMYVDFQNNYMTTRERKTSIHIEILGCIFLILSGLKISADDYKIPDSEDTISYSTKKITETLLLMRIPLEQILNALKIVFNK